MKRGLKYLSLLILSVSLAACVGNKKLAYLQDKDAGNDERYKKEASITAPSDAYHLKSGDVLYVNMEKFRVGEEIFSISNFQQFSRTNQVQNPYILGHRVDAEGEITLPLIGKVKAEGKSIDELQDELSKKADEQYPGSVVEVFQLDGMVSVLGEVNQPGRYPIYRDRNTIFDLLAQSGDMKDYANRSEVKIIREENGQQVIFHIDLNDYNALSQKGYFLQNDDIVVVTPLNRRKFVTTNIQWLVGSVTALVAIASLVVSITR